MVRVTYNRNGSTSGSVPTDNTTYNPGDTVTVLGNTGNLVKNRDRFAYWTRTIRPSRTASSSGADGGSSPPGL